jgi:hypothetical protein
MFLHLLHNSRTLALFDNEQEAEGEYQDKAAEGREQFAPQTERTKL